MLVVIESRNDITLRLSHPEYYDDFHLCDSIRSLNNSMSTFENLTMIWLDEPSRITTHDHHSI